MIQRALTHLNPEKTQRALTHLTPEKTLRVLTQLTPYSNLWVAKSVPRTASSTAVVS
jgi:hypothetical protein